MTILSRIFDIKPYLIHHHQLLLSQRHPFILENSSIYDVGLKTSIFTEMP
jgi:hypothetical protein